MESSEDDAGAATNASRRASAREKDFRGCEEGSASGGGQPAAAEAGATSETASMSEEAFDGDSVPSPSAQDVNTSTEAILDMIDEIVDGPGAPKRLTIASDDVDIEDTEGSNISEPPAVQQEPNENDAEVGTPQSSIQETAASAQSENVFQEDANSSPAEFSAQSDASTVEVKTEHIQPAQASSTVTENVPVESTLPEVPEEPIIATSSVTVEEEVTQTLPKPSAEYVPHSSSVACDDVGESQPQEPCVEPMPASSEAIQDLTSASTLLKPPDETPPASSSVVDISTVPQPPEQSTQAGMSVEVAVESSQELFCDKPVLASSTEAIEAASVSTQEPYVEPALASSTETIEVAAVSTQEPCEEPVLASSTQPIEAAGVSTLSVPPAEPAPVSIETEATIDCPVLDIPSSSVVETIQSESVTSENQTCERTNKCVTSSDNTDNVTVESAESTSSDSSVSERRVSVAEISTRSPLRRRLVRPTPSDRRPDSTVSSTVDSQTVNVHTTEQTTSECVTKDVSSSSEAVPAVYGNVKPEEIRNVSEISVCKAETSMSPPKKIKLIRQKVTPPPAVHKDITPESPIVNVRDQCQSTSSESHFSDSLPVLPEKNSNNTSTSKSEDVINELNCNFVVEEVPAQLQEPGKDNEEMRKTGESLQASNCLPEETFESEAKNEDQRKVPPIKLNLSASHPAQTSTSDIKFDPVNTSSREINQEDTSDASKQVPKLTIKLGSKQPEEMKSPIPKLTIKPIRPPADEEEGRNPSSHIPSVTKINIKPIIKPPEKITDIHRKSSSSEISESECSENDESNSASDHASTSDQTSASDQGSDVVPKVTIKLGKPGTESEGKFYTEKNFPKLTKGTLHHSEKEDQESGSKLKLVISHSEEKQLEKIPKLTIKTVTKSEGPPLSPKLTIKPLKPPENLSREITDEGDSQKNLHKQKVSTESLSSNTEVKENTHVPKITIKPVLKTDAETSVKIPKKSAVACDSPEHIPVVTKLNIKPILKPSETSENTHDLEEKLPVVSKLNIKPILRPSDGVGSTEVEDNVPVVSKLNIKPILKPVGSENITEDVEEKVHMVSKLTIKPILKPLDGTASDGFEDTIPVVSKLNIKPVMKPTICAELSDDLEKLPVVSKLNIKPILKPVYSEETPEDVDDKVPVVSKLNIKPIVKPKDAEVGSSIEDVPKITRLNIKPLKNPELVSSEGKDCDVLNADIEENSIPVVTKLNIKPVVKPIDEEKLKDSENQSSETGNSSDDNADHIPVVTKLNIKPLIKPNDGEVSSRSNTSNEQNIPVVTKLNIKPLIKPDDSKSPGSPKKDNTKYTDAKSPAIPVLTKLNIKPVIKPDEPELQKHKNDDEVCVKNPPLVMKINMKAVADISSNENIHSIDIKVNNIDDNAEHYNNVVENIPIVSKINIKPKAKSTDVESKERTFIENTKHVNCKPSSSQSQLKEMFKPNCVTDSNEIVSNEEKVDVAHVGMATRHHADNLKSNDFSPRKKMDKSQLVESTEMNLTNRSTKHININAMPLNLSIESNVTRTSDKKSSLQNCTLLKKLLETKKDGLDKRLEDNVVNANHSPPTKTEWNAVSKDIVYCESFSTEPVNSDIHDKNIIKGTSQVKISDDDSSVAKNVSSILDLSKESNENLTKPLEINVSDKVMGQDSGQDSPRIILKINKTDHGTSAKLITDEVKKPDSPSHNDTSDNTPEITNEKQKKNTVNNRKKQATDITPTMPMAKRLRSSRVAENVEKTPIVKKNVGKRPSTTDSSPPQGKETELSVLETKRLKLGQLLSNKSLSTTPLITKSAQLSPTKSNSTPVIPKTAQLSPTKSNSTPIITKPAQLSPTKSNSEIKPIGKSHSILNNENCSKNGNSKLHNILSNLQAKQAQAIAFNDLNCLEKKSLPPELECSTSTGSSDVIEVTPAVKTLPEVQQMLINESSESHDFNMPSDDISQDPLEVDTPKVNSDTTNESLIVPNPVEMTPQPKKRGRPRKLPVSEGAKPVVLPVPALEERPQRSLRLSRDRPAILVKPRGGRGRGRGAKRQEPIPAPEAEPIVETATKFFVEEQKPEEFDPTSSRIKLPRMTEALDNMPNACMTPLSSRRRNSSTSELKMFEPPELKVVLENTKIEDVFVKSPETPRRGRGSRGGRGRAPGRSPRGGRGRARGGGRGAMYMKETMGIYGRVCGPATTTVQLFEEETCMMDDNATPAKPSHLLDEDSQSSVKSSTNESSKLKKSKFADLFDSNKVWTAADVKEYMWPPLDRPQADSQVMMIQEQVAMFLGVKSFKRRYPELKRRTIVGEERDYVLSKELVTEALCDLGITAVDASEVLDIMLSDYPHKYEEYRSHQRQKQLAVASSEETTQEPKPDQKMDRIEMKIEMKPAETKPEPPKIDLEKSRQDMAAAAIASASEFNARMNSQRRPSCVDMQTLTIHRRRAPPRPPASHVRPPAGFYPHALLPGQYQHCYKVYTPEQLRYFPLNTAVAAPPAPPSPAPLTSDSEQEWSSTSSDDSNDERLPAKRKKLTKTKRSSQAEAVKEEPPQEVDLCRVCKLRLEANRKYTHERFLVCANCNAKLHPGCVELSADTIRKCREYAWQCAECKTCCACHLPADDDKMLFCDLCDRGHHIYCVGLTKVPSGRWHCVECAICKSCGARDPSGLPQGTTPGGSTTPVGSTATPGVSTGTPGGSTATPGGSTAITPSGSISTPGGSEWHHQTRRGPGGHKVYSHSLCTPCARAYRIGRYCPLCDRSFIGPKGTMQLVICKLCDRQHHQDCVRQTVSQLNVLDYTCSECRRGGITSRAAAVRLAPRTIATLFMAKRRFNKYAHRQYMQSRLQGGAKLCLGSENSEDVADRPDDASDASDGAGDASDPLDGAGDAAAAPAHDEAAAAVEALRMDFGD